MNSVASSLEFFSAVNFGQGVVIAIAFVIFFVINELIFARHDRRLGRSSKFGFHRYMLTLTLWECVALFLNGILSVALIVFAGSYM